MSTRRRTLTAISTGRKLKAAIAGSTIRATEKVWHTGTTPHARNSATTSGARTGATTSAAVREPAPATVLATGPAIVGETGPETVGAIYQSIVPARATVRALTGQALTGRARAATGRAQATAVQVVPTDQAPEVAGATPPSRASVAATHRSEILTEAAQVPPHRLARAGNRQGEAEVAQAAALVEEREVVVPALAAAVLAVVVDVVAVAVGAGEDAHDFLVLCPTRNFINGASVRWSLPLRVSDHGTTGNQGGSIRG